MNFICLCFFAFFQTIGSGDNSIFAYDSSNVRFIGNWPFGPSNAVAIDQARNLVFMGSGGGVSVLNVANPSAPV
ncbi:MAG: hypothetical protein ABIL07_04165, partial [candidate division WOR-3 bacterium]